MIGPILISIILLWQFFFFLWIMLQYRIPIGHDGFQYFTLQYYFLNNQIFYQQSPLWLPYMTQGTVSSWWYGVQAGLLSNALSVVAPLLKNFNFIHLFALGFWVDELVLMIGCYLWAKQFYRHTLSIFFFTASVVISSIWWTQPWYNFHLYYFLPLMFYFTHRFLRTKSIKYIFIIVCLLIINSLGNLPYFFPMTSMLVALYMGLCMLNGESNSVRRLMESKKNWIIFILLSGIIFYVYCFILTYGTDQIRSYSLGREVNLTTNIQGFLNYGGSFSVYKWLEMIVGISPSVDYTLYGGVLIVPFLLAGIKSLFDKKVLPILIFTLLILNLTAGGLVAQGVYYIWPMMKYYRHLGLLAIIVKILICFMSAFVFDKMLNGVQENKRYWFINSILFALIALFVSQISPYIIDKMVVENWPEAVIYKKLLFPTLEFRFQMIGNIALIAAGICFALSQCRSQRILGILVGILMMLHLFDLGFYKINETLLRSWSLQSYKSQMTFKAEPFHRHRQIDLGNSKRLDMIQHLPLAGGVQYWTNNSFANIDQVNVPWKVEHWLLPLDQYMRTYWQQPIDNVSIKPKGLIYYKELNFPLNHPAIYKISGISEEKIQFFTNVIFVAAKDKISKLMVDSDYQGDIPLVHAEQSSMNIENKLNQNTREKLSYDILNFSPDILRIKFTSPNSGWLLYSDVWHPGWEATVNHVPVHVYNANLAYKIIPINSGFNEVCFSFGSWQIRFCRVFLAIFSLLGMVCVFWLIWRMYVQK